MPSKLYVAIDGTGLSKIGVGHMYTRVVEFRPPNGTKSRWVVAQTEPVWSAYAIEAAAISRMASAMFRRSDDILGTRVGRTEWFRLAPLEVMSALDCLWAERFGKRPSWELASGKWSALDCGLVAREALEEFVAVAARKRKRT